MEQGVFCNWKCVRSRCRCQCVFKCSTFWQAFQLAYNRGNAPTSQPQLDSLAQMLHCECIALGKVQHSVDHFYLDQGSMESVARNRVSKHYGPDFDVVEIHSLDVILSHPCGNHSHSGFSRHCTLLKHWHSLWNKNNNNTHSGSNATDVSVTVLYNCTIGFYSKQTLTIASVFSNSSSPISAAHNIVFKWNIS